MSVGNHTRGRRPSLRAKVLRLLQEDGAAWTVAEVANWLDVRPESIGPVLCDLRADGFLDFEIDGQDVRYRAKGDADA